MHVDVSNLLSQREGERADFVINDEQPALDDIVLTSPLDGQLGLIRTTDGLLADLRLNTVVQLECDRCLQQFQQPVDFAAAAVFADRPADGEYQISRQGRIDLSEPVRQEILLSLPLQQLCSQDCAGLTATDLKKEKHGSTQKTNH